MDVFKGDGLIGLGPIEIEFVHVNVRRELGGALIASISAQFHVATAAGKSSSRTPP
jgi:hypothetical protein